MDELLQRAIDRRESLRRELKAIEAFIASYSATVGERSGRSQREQADLFASKDSNRRKRSLAVAAMMDEAESLILSAGHPLTRGELVRLLEERGHEVEGTDKSKVLGTNLWRSKRFHNILGVGYWPKKSEIPEPFARHPIRDSALS